MRTIQSVLSAAFITLLGLTSPLKAQSGTPVTYQLPPAADKTYLVTLAIVDPKNPDWIVSTFLAGEPRTVTAQNKGKFTEVWDGLDENFMPVPPGDYAVKGIYSPATQWQVDGEWHTITPLFAGGASPWLPAPDQWDKPVPFGGDPVNAPLKDVAVGPNGVAVFYYQYLENGTNCPMFDLNKPVSYDQFIRAFISGGAGGGPCAATDGETVWAFSTDGGPKYLYRSDQKSFGQSPTANRRNGQIPEGWVTAMAAQRDQTGASFVYVAQRGKIDSVVATKGSASHKYSESTAQFVDQVTIHNGEDGAILARVKLSRPQGLVLNGGSLYALHLAGDKYTVSRLALKAGLPDGDWKQVFTVPANITPADLEMDSTGRFYLSDSTANKVFQLDAKAKVLLTYGRLDVQKSGSYDRETLMSPAKLAVWKAADGKDRLIIVESHGPNRVSEWSTDEGKLLREFMSHQTKCNSGYAVDPADPTHIYLPGHGDWLTRFKINYDTREWTVDAVWPDVPAGQRKGLEKLVAVRANNNQLYLASEKSLLVYRMAGDRFLRSAGLVYKEKDGKTNDAYLWSDASGNGEVEENELTPTQVPKTILTYHGQRWLADLSYIAPAQSGQDVWRLAPESFDQHGNPVFKSFQKVLTDPIFAARRADTATALYGGNELADTFSSDWMQTDGSVADGFYVQARGGKSFNANSGPQHKVSRYVPDGKGGYTLKWRVGRSVLGSEARRGEIEGGMRLYKPINGLLTVVDQSRSGLFLYTEDGLYVDTVFPASRKKNVGAYQQPGEFFAGVIYPHAGNGKIYYGSGKYTPLLYEMEGWSLKENPVQRLTTVQKTVSITAAQIASPPEIALSLRGGAGSASVARFSPALGGAVLDGSLTGWESVEPVTFSASKEQTVEVRGLYDPEDLHLRWHVRLGVPFQAKPLPPLERLFTHDQNADTVSLYIQGDTNAAPKGPAEGRPGDARFVFGLFKDGDQIKVASAGMHPRWPGKGARPQVYRTPVGQASFAHVGAIDGVKAGYVIDPDGKGFVIAASIPRSAIPALKTPFGSELRTMVNFDANLGGNNKFWWANTDGSASRETYDEPSEARLYPGSWAPITFQGLDQGAVVKNWLVLGPFGGPGAENFKNDPQAKMKDAVRNFYEQAVLPPDQGPLDFSATYEGGIVQGYWKDPGKVKWHPATLADLDTRAIIGQSAQVWYGATWVYSPAETEVEFAFQGHPMTPLRWFVNDVQIKIPDKEYKEGGDKQLRTASRPVTLKKGWNQIHYRGYNFGYTPFRVGLVLKAPAEKLWPLRFSGSPQRSAE